MSAQNFHRKMMIIFFVSLGTLALSCNHTLASNVTKACYLITDQRDWGASTLGAADSYLEAAEVCHTGDHLTVAELPVRQVGYFIIAACDPAFAITTLEISDSLVSVTCVKSHDKELRQN